MLPSGKMLGESVVGYFWGQDEPLLVGEPFAQGLKDGGTGICELGSLFPARTPEGEGSGQVGTPAHAVCRVSNTCEGLATEWGRRKKDSRATAKAFWHYSNFR